MKTYRVYGITLASDFAFDFPLPRTDAPPELTFTCIDDPGHDPDLADVEPLYASRPAAPGRDSDFRFFRLADHDVVSVARAADYHVFDDHIRCHLRVASVRFLIEIQLLGMVLAFWLERRGVATLHGSAAVVGDCAIGVLADRGGGKSSTVAALLAAGHPLLSDDLLALDVSNGADGPQVSAQPGFPQVRLWPEQADHFVGDASRLARVRPDVPKVRIPVGGAGLGRFEPAGMPLGGLFVLDRRDDNPGDDIVITSVPAREAVMQLVRFSFLPVEVERFGWAARRMPVLAAVSGRVPVQRVSFPAGYDHLPAVCAAMAATVTG